MNRKIAIKNILALGFFGVSIYSSCRWTSNNLQIREEFFYSYKELIAELADTIIPITDTPGASDTNVVDFILKIIIQSEDVKTQRRFLLGLRNLQEYSKKRYGSVFQNCILSERICVLEHYENKEFKSRILKKVETEFFGEPFISTLKNLTVIGFCTSEVGATRALVYDFIPVNYQSCVPLSRGQKSWATK